MKRRNITLRELAEACGLSVMAASYAMNGSSEVSEDTQARVQKMAVKIGYVANRSARGLRNKQTGLIALVCKNPSGILDLRGLLDLAQQSGFAVIVFHLTDPAKDAHSLGGWRIEGAVWDGPNPGRTEFPVVPAEPDLMTGLKRLIQCLKK